MGDLPNIVETSTTIVKEEKIVKPSPLALLNVKENNWKGPSNTSALEKKLEMKLLHKDEKLQELRTRCAHLLKVEKRCNDLHNELSVKKEHVEVLTKSQACMQQQVDDAERRHTEDLTLLVRALEKAKMDLGSQEKLIGILVRDLQKMKSTLEYCKDELLVKDERVSVLKEDLRKAKHLQERTKTPSKIHRTRTSGLHVSKRKFTRSCWQPLTTPGRALSTFAVEM